MHQKSPDASGGKEDNSGASPVLTNEEWWLQTRRRGLGAVALLAILSVVFYEQRWKLQDAFSRPFLSEAERKDRIEIDRDHASHGGSYAVCSRYEYICVTRVSELGPLEIVQ